MVTRPKINSSETSLFYAKEETLGVLPATPDWRPLEPNEYDDFGGELTLLARRPINANRQRKKGSITDLDASGGFNQDLTLDNTMDILQGVMFAALRNKATEIATAVTGTHYAVADNVGFAVGNIVLGAGFNTPANNGRKVVTAVAAGEITVAGLTAEAFPPATNLVTRVGIVSAAGDIDVTTTGDFATYTSTVFDFTALGLIPGEWIFVGGDAVGSMFDTPGNNGFKRVRSIAANAMVVDQSPAAMATEANTTLAVEIYFGAVLKNELAASIVQSSYHLERQLGAPDTANPSQIQAEYLVGSVPSEYVVNIESADKINCDFSFVSLDHVQRTATDGPMAGNRLALVESDAFNTSSDFTSMRMSIYTQGVEAPTPLFGYVTELTLTINNNLTVNKAIGVLGGFDITAGTFEVSAEATAYFSTVEAVQAVRNNENVQMYAAVAKENRGFVMDLPLIALGNGRLDVAIDEPIMLPLTMDAATAAKINPNMDYTLLWTFFAYLPTVAEA